MAIPRSGFHVSGCALAFLSVLLSSCSSVGGPTDEQMLRRTKDEAMAAGYRADLATLEAAARRTVSLRQNPQLAPMAHYWAAYAWWQHALNGANRNLASEQIRADLDAALAELAAALQLREDFADAHAMAALIHGWLTKTFRADAEKFGQHQRKQRSHLARAKQLEPSNPRVIWVEATILFNRPKQFGGDPIEAIRLFEQIPHLSSETISASISPDWGHAEALMSLAYALSTMEGGDLTRARELAQRALALRPNWYYVRTILIPRLEARLGPS